MCNSGEDSGFGEGWSGRSGSNPSSGDSARSGEASGVVSYNPETDGDQLVNGDEEKDAVQNDEQLKRFLNVLYGEFHPDTVGVVLDDGNVQSMKDDVNEMYSVHLLDPQTGNFCWSTILVKDEVDPEHKMKGYMSAWEGKRKTQSHHNIFGGFI